jgi:hypothetical protein
VCRRDHALCCQGEVTDSTDMPVFH